MELNGRFIDTSCPFETSCFGNQGCFNGSCPETLLDVLKSSALAEHELEMLPHTDPDLAAVCTHIECRIKWEDVQRILPLTPNEIRGMINAELKRLRRELGGLRKGE